MHFNPGFLWLYNHGSSFILLSVSRGKAATKLIHQERLPFVCADKFHQERFPHISVSTHFLFICMHVRERSAK
jgi:hypothetical protein